MRIGVFAKTFPGSDPATVLSQAAAAGFDGPLVAHGFGADEAPGVAAFLRQQRQAL